ncbi:FAD:protein FMN transferase [Microbacterium sp. MC2]
MTAQPADATWRFDAIGTRWRIDTATPLTPAARARITALVETFDATWSRFRGDSLVRALARQPGTVPAPVDATAMLDAFAALSDATGGAVNPLIGDSLASALEHPFDPRRAVGVWEVTDAALCASAVNRRAWGDGLHHVLDARTGHPVRTIAATWAVAETAMWADGLATALFFDGGPALAARSGVAWVRMTTDGRLEWSPGCPAELFTTQ